MRQFDQLFPEACSSVTATSVVMLLFSVPLTGDGHGIRCGLGVQHNHCFVRACYNCMILL